MPNHPQNDVPVNIGDLRKIVHGIKMMPTGFLEDAARSEIEAMIKALPTSESMGQFADDEHSMFKLKKMVGDIMALVEVYGNRNPEFKARYRARTGLPPRYKVLDRSTPTHKVIEFPSEDEELERAAMKKNKNLVRGLLVASSVVDDVQPEISGKLIVCAKNVGDKDSDIKVNGVVKELQDAGFVHEASFIQEAAFEGITDKVKSMWGGGQKADAGEQEHGYTTKMVEQLNGAISKFEQSMDTQTLLDETNALMQWVDKVNKMSSPTDRAIAQKYTQFIQKLQKGAYNFNKTLYGQFEEYVEATKAGIAKISDDIYRALGIERNEDGTGTTPLDADNDGVPDSVDPDADGDGKADAEDVVETPGEVAQEKSDIPVEDPAEVAPRPPKDLSTLTPQQRQDIRQQLTSRTKKSVKTSQLSPDEWPVSETSDSDAMDEWIKKIKSDPAWQQEILEELGQLDDAKVSGTAPTPDLKTSPTAPVPLDFLDSKTSPTAPEEQPEAAPAEANGDTITGSGQTLKQDMDRWVSKLEGMGMSPEEVFKKVQRSARPTNHSKYISQYMEEYRASKSAPAAAPAQPSSLDSVDEGILNTIINQALPNVWNKGWNGTSVGLMTHDQKKQVIREKVPEKALPQYIENARQASTKIPSKGAMVEWKGGSGKISGVEDGKYIIRSENGTISLKPIDSVREVVAKSVRSSRLSSSSSGGFNLRKFVRK